MLRPTPLRRYVEVMRAKGHAVESLVVGTGLTAHTLEDPQALLERHAYQRVIENMVGLTGETDLGLEIGLQRDVKDFGILGYAALTCRSIRHSVEEFWGGRGGYGDLMGMVAKIVIPRGSSDTVTVDIAAPPAAVAVQRFLVEEALCLLLKVGGQVSGVAPRFSRLEFAYPAPAYAPRYRQVFGCPVRFSAARTRASFDREWFERPLASSDPDLVQLYKERLSRLRETLVNQQPLVARLEALFEGRRGVPSLDSAARELGLSPRSLRRQLQKTGTSYRVVGLAFRLARAEALIRSGTVAAKQISDEVGFSDVNAFRRAFKQWTGRTLRGHHIALLDMGRGRPKSSAE